MSKKGSSPGFIFRQRRNQESTDKEKKLNINVMPVLNKRADVNEDTGDIVETLSFQVGNGKKKKTDKFNPQL